MAIGSIGEGRIDVADGTQVFSKKSKMEFIVNPKGQYVDYSGSS